jgi:NAD(P)-dependent dehydrogenase (short-subunit alcohol dehydrogenase family)
MPKLSQIRLSNSKIGSSSFPRVAVFVGGTSGIGKITLGALATAGHKFKVYVVGRKASEEAFKIFAADLSETVEIVWNEGEVSLLAEVKRICEDILSREESIDLLFLTTGYAPFAGRESMPTLIMHHVSTKPDARKIHPKV